MKKMLIGGQRLRDLGSSRHTNDLDYLIFDTNQPLFINAPEADYINASKYDLLTALWNVEKDNKEVSVNGMVTLCGWAFINHLRNLNFNKANDKEFDLSFLGLYAKKHDVKIDFSLLYKYEVKEMVDEVVKEVKKYTK